MKYLDADKMITEIERQQRRLIVLSSDTEKVNIRRDCAIQNGVYNSILDFINSFQQKQLNADLEKEIKEEYLKHRCYGGRDNMLVILNEPQFNEVAKYFYSLGLAQKGE